ncbi:hypothetical protein JTB14_009649 [Gonioctena quinquepunctata]|nr:hypothetical protein JTB14_009649 [Gonioctena quinquepunctata]
MKFTMSHSSGASIFVILLVGIVLFGITTTNAAPHQARYYPGYYSPMSLEAQNPEYLLQTIARLRQALINDDDLENMTAKRSDRSRGQQNQLEKQDKRVIDLGTQSRDYAAKMENLYHRNAAIFDRLGK